MVFINNNTPRLSVMVADDENQKTVQWDSANLGQFLSQCHYFYPFELESFQTHKNGHTLILGLPGQGLSMPALTAHNDEPEGVD